jgi:hypothetical protein
MTDEMGSTGTAITGPITGRLSLLTVTERSRRWYLPTAIGADPRVVCGRRACRPAALVASAFGWSGRHSVIDFSVADYGYNG